jgi:predicted negative regulator of RcsB-dependent stress response
LAKKSRSDPGDALEQLQTFSDYASHWIATNPTIIVGVLGVVLVLAASYGGWRAWSGSRNDAASAALAEARTAYLESMGRSPGAGAVELANPEIAQRVRIESIERYLQVSDEHQGTPAAAVAQLEAADLLLEDGDLEAARELWVAALDSGDASAALRGMLLERVAGVDEREESVGWMPRAATRRPATSRAIRRVTSRWRPRRAATCTPESPDERWSWSTAWSERRPTFRFLRTSRPASRNSAFAQRGARERRKRRPKLIPKIETVIY